MSFSEAEIWCSVTRVLGVAMLPRRCESMFLVKSVNANIS